MFEDYDVETAQVGPYTVRVKPDNDAGHCSPLEYEETFTLAFACDISGNKDIRSISDYLDELAEDSEPGFQDFCEREEAAMFHTTDPAIAQANPHAFRNAEEGWSKLAKRTDERRARILAKHYLIRPIFVYEHSGVSMTTGTGGLGYPYTCRFDTRQSGLIVITKDAAREMMMVKRLTKAVVERIHATMNSVVETYGQWCNGEVYGYVVEDADGEEVDSCWGFIGDGAKCALKEGKDSAQSHFDADIAESRRLFTGFTTDLPAAVSASIGA